MTSPFQTIIQVNNISILEAGENDSSIIQQLADKIWHDVYPEIISEEQITYMLEEMYSNSALLQQIKEGHKFYIAFKNKLPIGFFSYSKKSSQNYFLHKLYIKTSEHRKGIGHYIMNYFFGLIHQGSSIRLTVNRKNYKAINFYFKHGFFIEDVKDFDIGNGYVMNDFVMLLKK